MNPSPEAWVAIYVETHAQRLHVDLTMRRQGHSIYTQQCIEPNIFYSHSRGIHMSNVCDLSERLIVPRVWSYRKAGTNTKLDRTLYSLGRRPPLYGQAQPLCYMDPRGGIGFVVKFG